MLIRFNDFDYPGWLINDFQQRVQRLFNEIEQPAAATTAADGWADLEDTPEALVVRADLPGFAEKDVEVTLQNEVLTLAGQRTVEAPEGYRAHLRERRPYRFTRSFSLPVAVDPERVSAHLADGVLTVRLAKAPESKPRQINVSAG